MKKLLLGFLCLASIISISCTVPESITIKGSPELYVPLGSPFDKEKEGLVDYISTDKIKEIMNKDGDNKLEIYEYMGSAINGIADDTLTYLVHYPIADMQLELDEYVESVIKDNDVETSIKIPAAASSLGPIFNQQFPTGCYLTNEGSAEQTFDEEKPTLSIPLDDMVKLVREVNVTELALEIPYSVEFEDNILISIPAFGIINEQRGTPSPDGKWLRFVNSTKTKFEPRVDLAKGNTKNKNSLDIYVKLEGPVSGTIDIKIVFDWIEATIDATGNDFEGEYLIENEDALSNFLGGAKFKKVLGYMYVDGIEDPTPPLENTIALEALNVNTNTTILNESSKFYRADKPDLRDPFDEDIPTPSITPIDLTAVLNSGANTNLKYKINLAEWKIYRNALQSEKITADLIIMLPLELEIRGTAEYTFPINGDDFKYIQLDLEDIYTKDDDKDIFGRDGDDDGLLRNLDWVEISIKSLEKNDDDLRKSITAIDPKLIAILVEFGTEKRLISSATGWELGRLDSTNYAYPFSPDFKVLLEKDKKTNGTYEDYATFKVKRPDPGEELKFDFNVVVEAKVKIDETKKF
ncbi:MAG: hypothetical protein FWH53_07295 [Leptospirales bacterium]|nr:hypothetical protein [Leptospirales bacterium]